MEKLDQQIQTAIQEIQQQVGNEKVLVLVSGGVDSAVSAALLLKAIPPERVYAIHVDHGLMRLNESDQICDALNDLGLIHLKRMNAQDFFFNSTIDTPDGPIGPLTTLNDPEKRRIVIGTLFIKLIEQIASEMGLDFSKTYWAQGTIKPDLLETANPDYTDKGHIKTHHNDVDLVREARSRGLVVETNKLWFKDEVRQVALRLGIPEDVAYRQPFPGPGLGVRIMGYDGTEAISREQKDAFDRLLTELAVPAKKLQAEVIPIKTVGVHDEQRSYRYFALFSDTAPFSDIDLESDWSEMENLAKTIPNRLDFINRVVYRLNPSGPNENYVCFPTKISRENAELLRQVDARVSKVFAANRKIAQAFAILLPVGQCEKSCEKPYSVVIRAVITQDFMVGRPARIGEEISVDSLRNLVAEIVRDFPQIDFIGYDFTPKPPATVEWM